MQLKKLKGFSLVEILVANSLFGIVIVLAIATIIALNDVNTRMRTARLVFEDLNVLLDSMTRDIRQGNNYGCIKDSTSLDTSNAGNDCDIDYSVTNSGIGVDFISEQDTIYSVFGGSSIRTRYYLENNQIVRERFDVDSGGNILNTEQKDIISGENIYIKEFDVYVVGSAGSGLPDNDTLQPIVHMRIIGNKISPQNNELIKDFDIYTSVSQRESDS